jgi:hypothetical protein
VQEYYIIDPDPLHLNVEIFERYEERLQARHLQPDWVSPLMGVRLKTTPGNVGIFYPDGRPFLSFVELGERQKQIEEALRSERQRAAKLAAKLREMGVDPDAL